ncbi:MAG: GDSL-type esterase/lipase family protein [Cyclobacteriaceae bacterium]
MKNVLLTFLVLTLINYATAQIKVACVGNSITYGAGIEERDSLAYPPQLQRILGSEWLVENFGRSGATLLRNGNLPYWDQPEFEQAKSFGADVVIIMLGTNDSKPMNWEPYKGEYVKDYHDLIGTFRAINPEVTVFICFPIPVVETKWGIDKQVMEEEIPLILQSIAKSEKVKTIDLYIPLEHHLDLIPDKIHPDAAGSKIMATEVAETLLKNKKRILKKM